MRRIGFVPLMQIGFVPLFLIVILAAGLTAEVPGISMTSLEAFEHRLEAKLAQPGPYPYEVMFPAPAIYVPGVGVVLSSWVEKRQDLVDAIATLPAALRTQATERLRSLLLPWEQD